MNRGLSIISNFFANRRIRFNYLSKLGLLNWLSDTQFLKIKYKIFMGKELNLDKPATLNEKLQWLKIHDRKPEYTLMVDKYSVKKLVADQIGDEYVIPTIGVWDHFEDIDFTQLPDQFVLKCTHDSGGLVICRDKTKFCREAARSKIERSLKSNFYWQGREWPYRNVKPRILAEAYMEDGNAAQGLMDYKFFCFNGEPKFLYVSQGMENHNTAFISFYDLMGKPMPFHRKDFRPMEGQLVLPINYPELQEVAKKLAVMVNNPFVRIDLYSIRGKVFFSEITFSPCSGMIPFEPAEWDAKLGAELKLPPDA